MVDLRVLVHQMQTDTFNWDIASFVASQRAVDLREAKADGPPVDPEAQPRHSNDTKLPWARSRATITAYARVRTSLVE